MPELPEVETVRRGLERCLVGRVIVGGAVPSPKILKPPVTDPEEFLAGVRGAQVQNVRRRGKHLIFGLDNGYALVSHLKMRGHMRVLGNTVAPSDEWSSELPNNKQGEPDDKFLRLVLDLDNGSQFRFYDIWGWGEMRLVRDDPQSIAAAVPALATMGGEPLSDSFTVAQLKAPAARHPKTTIKAYVLNQDVVAGVGNIYADESLHEAGIDPGRPVGSLSDPEWERLYHAIRAVLGEALRGKGTVSDNFFDTSGSPGGYVPRVYERGGQPCRTCGATLEKRKIAGRTTVSCPACQV